MFDLVCDKIFDAVNIRACVSCMKFRIPKRRWCCMVLNISSIYYIYFYVSELVLSSSPCADSIFPYLPSYRGWFVLSGSRTPPAAEPQGSVGMACGIISWRAWRWALASRSRASNLMVDVQGTEYDAGDRKVIVSGSEFGLKASSKEGHLILPSAATPCSAWIGSATSNGD